MRPIPAQNAWLILGKDPEAVFAAIPRAERAAAAAEDLVEARKLAKALMALHHPDRGGDPEKFRMVGRALASIEEHVDGFSRALAEAERAAGLREEKRPVFIKLG